MNKLNLRFQFFLLSLSIIVIALFLFSANNAEARHTLETSYSLANKDWCAPLNFKDNAQYLSNQLSMLTAESASPLLGLTLVGTFKNICAPDELRDLLPWYYQWGFLGTMLGILILVMFKDTGLTFLGPIKKPLDALGEVINVLGGIVTLPIAVTYFSDGTAYEIADLIVSISHGLLPVAHAAESVTLASSSALLLLPGKIIGIMMGLLIYSVVWILGNTIEVLILISPVPFIDTALKSLRSFLLVAFTFIAYQFPVQGAIIALIIIFISWRVFGWSYRLFTFGFLFGADFLGFCANFFREKRQNTTMEEKNSILAFTGEGIVRPKNRSLGRLYKNESGDLEFIYYPWLILPSRHIFLDKENTIVVRGKIFNVIAKRDSSTEKNQTLFTLPPRYRGKEDSLGTYLELPIIK